MIFKPLYPYLAVLIVLAGLYGAHRYIVYDSVKSATQQIEQKHQKALDQAEAQAKEIERSLKMIADKDKERKDVKIASIAAELAAAERLLRNRPSRPANIATAPQSGASCTGRELYQEDGLFLRREAARAEALIEERDYYYNLYENARSLINGR